RLKRETMNLFLSRSCIALSKRTRSGSSRLLAGALVATFFPQLSRSKDNGKTKKNFLISYLRGGSLHVSMMITDGCGYFQHFLDFPAGIRTVKDCRTRNQDLGARFHDLRDRIDIDTAVDFDNAPMTMVFNKLPGLANLLHSVGDERLASEARIHCHDEQHVR